MKRVYTIAIVPYTLLLFYMMFFASGRDAYTMGFIQLNRFSTITHFFIDNVPLSDFLVNILGNIFVFSPFGALGLIHHKLLNGLLLSVSFMISIISIELIQYYTARGTADVDDVFLNTMGMFIGYLLLKYATAKNFANIGEEIQQEINNKEAQLAKDLSV